MYLALKKKQKLVYKSFLVLNKQELLNCTEITCCHRKTSPQENIVLFYKELNNILENSKQMISNKSTSTEVMRTELLNDIKLLILS